MFGLRLSRSSRAPAAPRIPTGYCIYAIGDIHGRDDLLARLHDMIASDIAQRHDDDQSIVVYLGDYVDRGNQSKEVIDRLINFDIPDSYPVFLKGNHEDAMLGFLDDATIIKDWVQYGGLSTLFSYGLTIDHANVGSPSLVEEIQKQFIRRLPDDHRDFLDNLRLSHTFGDYMFVHAGVHPNWPLHQQHPADMMWIRDEFMRSTKYFGKVIVHGHTIVKQPDFQPNRISIDTGAYASEQLTCLVLQGTQRRWFGTRSPAAIG